MTCASFQPEVDEHGVLFCTEEKCCQYDGKRCRLIGFRPGNICEPAVRQLIIDLKPRRGTSGNPFDVGEKVMLSRVGTFVSRAKKALIGIDAVGVVERVERVEKRNPRKPWAAMVYDVRFDSVLLKNIPSRELAAA